jgi:hypothetical protein
MLHLVSADILICFWRLINCPGSTYGCQCSEFSVSYVLTVSYHAPYRIQQLIIFKFLSPTNAPLYYTCKMLEYTVKISHDCSYMFWSTWTIIREPMPNIAKVTILCRYSVKLLRAVHAVHTTAWNTFYQHCWTFNDVFLLSMYTKL